MRIAICDDEKRDLELIHSYCVRFDPSLTVELFYGGTALLQAYKKQPFDLIFLDIEMDAPNGMTVGTALMKYSPQPVIIFITHSFSLNYAIRGYGIAMKYLPKPVSYETFLDVIGLALGKILPQKLTITCDGEKIVVPIRDIAYFEVLHHEVIFHIENGHYISRRGTLSDFKAQLSQYGFFQPHKSYCVNMNHIDHFSRQQLTMTNGDVIPISRSKTDAFQTVFKLFLKGNSAL